MLDSENMKEIGEAVGAYVSEIIKRQYEKKIADLEAGLAEAKEMLEQHRGEE